MQQLYDDMIVLIGTSPALPPIFCMVSLMQLAHQYYPSGTSQKFLAPQGRLTYKSFLALGPLPQSRLFLFLVARA